MFGTQDFIVFLVAGIPLNLIPGPDTLCSIGRSLAPGRRAGLLSVLGISTGSLVHTTANAIMSAQNGWISGVNYDQG